MPPSDPRDAPSWDPRPRVFRFGGAWVWRCRGHGESRDAPGGVGDVVTDSDWGDRAWATCFALAFRHGALYHGHGRGRAETYDLTYRSEDDDRWEPL